MNFATPDAADYDRAVLRLGRWAIDAVVTLLALYALVYIPLGNQTGYQHLKDILTTREAREAGQGLVAAARELRQKLLTDLGPIETPGAPIVPSLPKGGLPPDPEGKPGGPGTEEAQPELPGLSKTSLASDAGADASR